MSLPIKLNKQDCQRLELGEQIIKVSPLNDKLLALTVGRDDKAEGCNFKVALRAMRSYDSVRQLVINEGVSRVVPAAQTIADAIAKLPAAKAKNSQKQSVGYAALVLERVR